MKRQGFTEKTICKSLCLQSKQEKENHFYMLITTENRFYKITQYYLDT